MEQRGKRLAGQRLLKGHFEGVVTLTASARAFCRRILCDNAQPQCGTWMPVEEPSTASEADIGVASICCRCRIGECFPCRPGGHCQTNLNGPAKGADLRRLGRQFTLTMPTQGLLRVTADITATIESWAEVRREQRTTAARSSLAYSEAEQQYG